MRHFQLIKPPTMIEKLKEMIVCKTTFSKINNKLSKNLMFLIKTIQKTIIILRNHQ